MIRSVIAAVALFSAVIFQAQATPIDTYQFKSEDHQKRALTLANELRCPQCQNQNLIDSNSPVAEDLRLEVYKMVDDGKSDDEIVQFMTSRYGDFVLYKPRVENKTIVLWAGPIALFAIGLIVVFMFVRRQKQQPAATEELTEEDQRQLDEILKRDQK